WTERSNIAITQACRRNVKLKNFMAKKVPPWTQIGLVCNVVKLNCPGQKQDTDAQHRSGVQGPAATYRPSAGPILRWQEQEIHDKLAAESMDVSLLDQLFVAKWKAVLSKK